MVIELISSIVTTIFLLYILSYYALLLLPTRRRGRPRRFASLSVIIPARNEEPCLRESIQSVLDARFPGTKQVIVIDDASLDGTAQVARRFGRAVLLLRNRRQLGKSASINKALERASGELVAIVDGDSIVAPDALAELAAEVGRPRIGGAAAVVKVRNRKRFLHPWTHLELMYNNLVRAILSKVGANVVTPGALSMYRTTTLRRVGGFNTDGFSEDVDVAIRLFRAGYLIGFAERAVSETYFPVDVKGFWRQRTRWARGMLYVLKRHMQMNSTVIDIYTLPLLAFAYVQAVIMGALTLYKIIAGYVTYFAAQGTYFSPGVVKFFFEWFSLAGFVRWTARVATGTDPLTFAAIVGIVSTLLTYPLFLVAITRYERLDLLHVVTLLFMAPFWLFVMVLYVLALPELLRSTQYNIWKKNER